MKASTRLAGRPRVGAGVVGGSGVLWALLVVISGCGVEGPGEISLPRVGSTYSGVLPADIGTADGSGDTDVVLDEYAINSIEPRIGLPSGGEIVFVEGRGFTESVKVYFDELEALEVFYVNSKKLRVTTPAHRLGRADVHVWWPVGQTRTLEGGFLFMGDLRVSGIEPSVGPIGGGTPVKVTGSGFTEGTRLVIGSRLAVGIEVLDENTIVAITPPGDDWGEADVLVSNELGTAQSRRLFTYSVSPELSVVEPGAGRAGDKVVLRGRWLSSVERVVMGGVEAEIVSKADDRLSLRVPDGGSGLVDVSAVGAWGWGKLEKGFLYLGSEGVSAVIPNRGPSVGGVRVSVVDCVGASEASGVVSVTFGGLEAEVLERYAEQCTLVVRTPAGSGLVNVKAGPSVVGGGYTYEEGMTIGSVEPAGGDVAGGTRVVLRGSMFPEGVQVLVGPFPAVNLERASEAELRFVTPPGSPGLVDISVIGASGTAVKRGAYLYTVKKGEIYAVRPNYGSQAGGTQVEIIGAGFSPTSPVYFDITAGVDVRVAGYGRIVARTPVSTVRTVPVKVGTSSGMVRLENAFSYFDPTAGQGGVWGSEIDGAVNVTVVDAYTWEGVPGVSVVLGSDVSTPMKGVTDARGQVTLSQLRLGGPQDVHAYRLGWDAASVIQTDGENVTVYLIPSNPPSTGPTEPPPTLDPGRVEGSLGGLNKYVILPPGSCGNVTEYIEGLCTPCSPQNRCPSGLSCMELEKGRFYCSRGCGGVEEEVCPEGYTCSPMGAEGSVCAPEQGRREARCELSTPYMSRSLFEDDYQATGLDGTFSMESRLGEVAVICVGGYTDLLTGEFHPVSMGVKRNINVAPGATISDLNIALNIPLNRSLRLRLDSPPSFSNYSGEYRVDAYLDLGSDGYYALTDNFTGLLPSDLVLRNLPESLTGDLYDAQYVFVGGAHTVIGKQSPYSIVYATDIYELDSPGVAIVSGGEVEERLDLPPWELTGIAVSGEEALLVGAGGRVVRYSGGTFRTEPSVTRDDWHAVSVLGDGAWMAVGSRGAAGQKVAGQWRSLGSLTDGELRDVAGQDSENWLAVGAQRVALGQMGEVVVELVAADLRAVELRKDGSYVMVGARGAMLSYDGSWGVLEGPGDSDLLDVLELSDGRLVVSAEDDVFREKVGGGWESLAAPGGLVGRRLLESSEGALYAAGAPGGLYRYEEAFGWSFVPIPRGLFSMDVGEGQAGELLVVGTPALLLTPFLPFPIFRSPVHEGGMVKLLLDWRYEVEDPPVGVYSMSITEQYGRAMWRVIAPGGLTRIRLPDFGLWLGHGPISGGEKRLRFQSGYAPWFNISRFDYSDMSTYDWGSFVYDIIHFD